MKWWNVIIDISVIFLKTRGMTPKWPEYTETCVESRIVKTEFAKMHIFRVLKNVYYVLYLLTVDLDQWNLL